MSVRIMSAVFESKTLGPTERLVMLALADHSDDAGRCYPSNARLCERTGLSERAVRNNIRALEQSGHLTVLIGVGQGGANVYHVHPDGGHEMPPAANAPGTKCRQGGHVVPEGGARNAPKPSLKHQEPSDSARIALCTVLSERMADDFIAHRKAKRAKLTGRAAELIAAKLRGHPSPDAVVEQSIMNGWTGVFPDRATPVAPFKPDFSKFGVTQ